MSDLQDLIPRVEALSGPDRELDGSIAWAIGLFDNYRLGPETHVSFYRIDDYDRAEIHVIGPKGGRMIYTPDCLRYTASLDAAMTLVPEGYDWIVGDVNGAFGGTPYACVGSSEQHFGNTAVLALCVAALKALIQTGDER